ncbi:MAG TPA: 2-oxoacid:acceptor oxidoreductase family protein [Nitrospirota bacterium]|nr:2-oxoacid:acceptor oxidoreductase family protein [Nitrospirota bacterium]
MMQRREIIISGSGGQGVVLGGIILAEAAAIYEDRFATHNQSYGPEARGGASKSEIIISDGMIHYPEVENPDILVALTQEAVDKFAGQLKPTGILITDTRIKKLPEKGGYTTYVLPIRDTAAKMRGEIITNMVTLGALVAITKIVSREALKQAALARIPKGTEAINAQALTAGIKIAEEM